MSSQVHEFDASEDGSFRISLTYDAPTGTGKTTAQTDTYHGHFVKLVPNEQVVEVLEFETTDPELRGEMTIMTRSLMQTAVPTCSSSTKGYLVACRPPTTRKGRGWHWRNSPRSLRRARYHHSPTHPPVWRHESGIKATFEMELPQWRGGSSPCGSSWELSPSPEPPHRARSDDLRGSGSGASPFPAAALSSRRARRRAMRTTG